MPPLALATAYFATGAPHLCLPSPPPQVGPGILRQISDVARKVRNTLRFLLGSLADYSPASHAVRLQSLRSFLRFWYRGFVS